MRQYVIFSNMILFNISVKINDWYEKCEIGKKKSICTNYYQFIAFSWPYRYRDFIRYNFFFRKLNYSIDSVHSINYSCPT